MQHLVVGSLLVFVLIILASTDPVACTFFDKCRAEEYRMPPAFQHISLALVTGLCAYIMKPPKAPPKEDDEDAE